jgi:hypothetical protein
MTHYEIVMVTRSSWLLAASDLKMPRHPEKIPAPLSIAITTKAGMPPLPSTPHRNLRAGGAV